MRHLKIKLSLFLNYFVFAMLLNSVGTVILLVQKTYHVSKSEVAVLEPFKDMSIAIVSFLVTSFITRIGYKKAMLTALAFISIICFLMPFTHGLLMVELLFASIGSSFALIKMSVYGSIGLITTSEKEHISLMNFVESFFGVGIVISYFVFPLFIDEDNPGSSAWLRVYYLLGAITVTAFVLLLTSSLDESAAKTEHPENMLADIGRMFRLLLSPLVLVFIVCAFFYVLLEQSIMSWLPTFNHDVLKLGEVLSIQMAAILSGSIALGRFLAGLVLKKLNWLIVLLICLFFAAALVLFAMPEIKNFLNSYKGSGITLLKDVPLIAFVFPLIGLVLAPVYPAINSVILSSLPKPQHGLMAGLIIVFSALGGSTGSLITGNIFEHYGGQTAFYFSLIPVIVLAVALIIFRKLQQKNVSGKTVSFHSSSIH
ncbi:MAG: MFS transporter [Bacteroidota bacterium]|nr:MFS transporter [Bacteroidota bacterium]